jgi:hypothetical protein
MKSYNKPKNTLILVLVLTSCNLPTSKATPTVDIIATRVAGTMAASQTSAAAIQPTAALPTVALETATPEPTATATLTPTATVNPSDPKLTLGTPDFTFNAASSGNPFGLAGSPYEDESILISHQVGGVTFASKAINGGKRWRLSAPTPTNFYLEGTFKVITCTGHDNYGLVMRVPSYTSTLGYFVGLSCDGSYIVDKIDAAGNAENMISWTADANIKTGEGQVNRLGVMLINDSFKIYINGVKVKEFTDGTITTAGHGGAYISARGNPNFTVQLQELLEWEQ